LKKKIIIPFIAWFLAGLLCHAGPAELRAETLFVTIGSGDFGGV